MQIISVYSYPSRYSSIFFASLEKIYLSTSIFGLNQNWLGLGWKLKIVARALEYVDSDLVLFADAFDSIIVHREDEIVKKFREFNHPFVCSAETNCHPDSRIASFYPVAPTRYRFLNSGGWIAEVDYARDLFRRLKIEDLPDDDNDQRFLANAFVRDPSILKLDYQCEIFQSLWNAQQDLSFDPVRGIFNHLTNTTPSVFHGNGGSDMTQVIAWSGLDRLQSNTSIAFRERESIPGAFVPVLSYQQEIKTMRASIVIASHNEGECLINTLKSCIDTTSDHLNEIEIVIVDDASTDGSIETVQHQYPNVRILSNATRQGTSPSKDRGARESYGNAIIFLDAHCNPEPGAIVRLIEDVEKLDGKAIVTPAVPHLEVDTWTNRTYQVGHTFRTNLETFACGWTGLDRSKIVIIEPGRNFFESPSLIACCAAMSRALYEETRGFDADLYSWGLEDLDLGLKTWLLGYSISHDPTAIVGHRFASSFSRYDVPQAEVVANKLRIAYKHFDDALWDDWVSRYREREPGNPWDEAFDLFEDRKASAVVERSYLFTKRIHDAYWYAETFELDWPRRAHSRRFGGGSHMISQKIINKEWSYSNAISSHDRSMKLMERTIGDQDDIEDRRELFLEHYRAPRNHRVLANADGAGRAHAPGGACVTFFVKFEEDGSTSIRRIARLTFMSERCGTAVAYASLLSELAAGMTIDEVKRMTIDDLTTRFGAAALARDSAALAIEALFKSIASSGSNRRNHN